MKDSTKKSTSMIIEVLDRETKGAYISEKYINFLKSLKERVQLQLKSEWSEEDIIAIVCKEKYLLKIVEVLNKDLPILTASIKRLRNLKPINN